MLSDHIRERLVLDYFNSISPDDKEFSASIITLYDKGLIQVRIEEDKVLVGLSKEVIVG